MLSYGFEHSPPSFSPPPSSPPSSFFSLLFPDQPSMVPLLFSLSGVPDTLRAQELTLDQMGQLTKTYQQLQLQSESNNTTINDISS